jgi:hypothetical protein
MATERTDKAFAVSRRTFLTTTAGALAGALTTYWV